jgi:TonB family protein
MKVANKLAILLSLGTFVSFASAKSLEQSYLDSCRNDSSIPVPISVVSPQIRNVAAGQTLEVEFTVSAAGKPSGINVLSSKDSQLSEAVVSAVTQWQFKPAQKDGIAVPMKVILPVHVVASEYSNRYVLN